MRWCTNFLAYKYILQRHLFYGSNHQKNCTESCSLLSCLHAQVVGFQVVLHIKPCSIALIELYIRTRGRTGLYTRPGMRAGGNFSKLTKQASYSVCSCGHFVSGVTASRKAFNKHKLESVLHIQRAYRMARVSPCGPVAFVQDAWPVCPLVLINNSMIALF